MLQIFIQKHKRSYVMKKNAVFTYSHPNTSIFKSFSLENSSKLSNLCSSVFRKISGEPNQFQWKMIYMFVIIIIIRPIYYSLNHSFTPANVDCAEGRQWSGSASH